MGNIKPVRLDVYRPLVTCSNCDLLEQVPINYGTLIKDEECPNCKCKTLFLFKGKHELTKYSHG